MNSTIYTKIYNPPPIDRKEVFRYAGAGAGDEDMEKLLSDCLSEISGRLTYSVCYAHLPSSVCEGMVDLSFTKVSSQDLAKNLAGCDSFVLFAATIGIECDRLIARYGRTSPLRALMFQAIGAERIESLCRIFNEDITIEAQKDGKFTSPRFSPGYGDLPLSLQKDFFKVLNPSVRIGVCLNESLLMSPAKSVTAIIGISDKERKNRAHSSCKSCNKTDCLMRKNV